MASLPKPERERNPELLADVRTKACCVCGAWPPSDPSHIKTRGSGGPDTSWNVFPKCRKHHHEWSMLGWRAFCQKYPRMRRLLEEAGWEVRGASLRHPALDQG